MRLIDADALIAEMHNIILEDGEDRRTFYEVIERQPTIEPERKTGKWIPVSEGELPPVDEDGFSDYILVSFENFSVPDIGQYRVDDDGSGAFYRGDSDAPYSKYGIFVNAWMPLPERYGGQTDE